MPNLLPAVTGWNAWLLAVLVYPGLLFGLVLAGVGEAGRALLSGRPRPRPGATAWRLWRRRAAAGPGAALAGLVVAAPLAALLLLPLPGHPLVRGAAAEGTLAVPGDLPAVLALLLGGNVAAAGIGLGASTPGAQLGGARLLRGTLLAAVPASLALAALTTMAGSLHIAAVGGLLLGAPSAARTGMVVAAAGALLTALPALGQWPPADAAGPDPAAPTVVSYLAGLDGWPLALARAGGALQRGAWAATWVVLCVPGTVPRGADPGAAGVFLAALGALLAGLALLGRRPAWPPDDPTALAWRAGLPLAGLALVLALLTV